MEATHGFLQLGTPLTAAQRRKGWAVVGLFVAFIVATQVFPSSPVNGVTLCPFHRLTGYDGFGCGMTRACVALMHGQVAASLTFHPFGIFFVLGFAATALDRLVQNLVGCRIDYPGRAFWKSKDNPVLIGCLIAVVVFGVLRFVLEVSGFLTPM